MQSLALMVGPLSGGAVAGAFGLDAVYLFIGGLLLLLAVGRTLFLQLSPARSQLEAAPSRELPAGQTGGGPSG